MENFEIIKFLSTIIFSIAIPVISACLGVFIFSINERKKIIIESERKEKSISDRYREFLGTSAYELQGRIHNISDKDFLTYSKPNSLDRNAINAKYYTAFLFGQFFAWMEIFRKDKHYLNFQESEKEIKILKELTSVEKAFSTDSTDKALMIFRGDQRAIGECMMIYNENIQNYECIEYSKFVDLTMDKTRNKWVKILLKYVKNIISEYHKDENHFNSDYYKRLTHIKASLDRFLDIIDPARKRFPKIYSPPPKMILTLEEQL